MNTSLRAFVLVSRIAVVPMLVVVPGLGDARTQGMDRRDDRRDDRGEVRDVEVND